MNFFSIITENRQYQILKETVFNMHFLSSLSKPLLIIVIFIIEAEKDNILYPYFPIKKVNHPIFAPISKKYIFFLSKFFFF